MLLDFLRNINIFHLKLPSERNKDPLIVLAGSLLSYVFFLFGDFKSGRTASGHRLQNVGQRLELDVRYRAFLQNVLRSRARRNNPGFHQTNRRFRSAFVLRLADTRRYDCGTEINDHLFEGCYSPKWPDGKKHARNVYAHTREECEEKLKVLIIEMKTELAELKKQKAKETLQPQAPEGKKGRKKSKKAKKDK